MNESPSTAVVGDTVATPVGELSYTEASRELDDIVDFFEQREVDVDLLVARLERATTIVDELDRRLRRTKAQVEQLVPRLEAAAAAERDEPDPDDAGLGEPDHDEPAGPSAARTGTGRPAGKGPVDPQGLF